MSLTINKLQLILASVNIFEESFSNPKLGLYSTRLYFILLIITSLILAFYSFFTTYLVTITVQQPTQDEFEKLHLLYPSTLVCPCSHISITYNEIMTTEPIYHQLCSSDFIRDDRWFIYYEYIKKPNETGLNFFYRYDFRSGAGLNLFYRMETLCTTAEETVYNALKQFNGTQFISSNAISRDVFDQKTNALIEQFQNETQHSFHTLFSKLRAAMENNQLVGLSDGKMTFRTSTIDQLRDIVIHLALIRTVHML